VNSLEVTSVLKDSQHNFFLRITALIVNSIIMQAIMTVQNFMRT